MNIEREIARELDLKEENVINSIELLDQGNTVPFIARYRKDQTGSMTDENLRKLSSLLEKYRRLEERKGEVKRLIKDLGKSSPEIEKSIDQAKSISEVDDIYRPFRPKRRTRAEIAREKGLEEFSDMIVDEKTKRSELEERARGLVDPEKDLEDMDQVLEEASYIKIEELSDNPSLRKALKSLVFRMGRLKSTKKEENETYKKYYDYEEAIYQVKGHRVLALNRGEKEGALTVKIEIDENKVRPYFFSFYPVSEDKKDLVDRIKKEAWRKIFHSIEREVRNNLTEMAENEAIEVFASNLKWTLMESPVRNKYVLALDPGYRNGCKLALTDPSGKVLETAVIYPVKPREDMEGSGKCLDEFFGDYKIDLLSLGNGTASRETEEFIRGYLEERGLNIPLIIVNEAGASVYSASELAGEELPDMDVSLRGAVSLARRVQDPLAELVKIDPKSIGVGQYQHDMNQKKLERKLDQVVEDCVNGVGCDLNTASVPLLSRISGISKSLAENIVAYRDEKGPFKERKDLLKVDRLGPKSYEQCAGFLRIRDGLDPLDNTSIHPESYRATKSLLKKLNIDYKRGQKLEERDLSQAKKEKKTLAEELGIGEMTLSDILEALEKPGRDSREELDLDERTEGISDIADLEIGMEVKGVVRNVSKFGAFVDIGVHKDGLVHISQMSEKFVKDPRDLVHVGQRLKCRVIDLDKEGDRISLTMKGV